MRTPSRRPTMRDVAARAGVSLKTVSRVVNREPNVRDELIARVEQAVRELQYRPDDRARDLRSLRGRPTSIGFAMVDVSNPFFSAILRGLEDVAHEHGCLVLSGSSDGDPDRQDALIETFIARRVEGLVVVPTGDRLGPIGREIEHGTPVVFVDCAPGATTQCDLVRSDHEGGAAAITAHLLAHGHRDIGFLGDDQSIYSARLRYNGFRAAMTAAGLPVDPAWTISGSHRPSEWRQVTAEWLRGLSRRPTAIVTSQNFVTIGAVEALHELGLEWQIAVVGYDDVDLSNVVRPGISVLPQDPRELGRRAGELLFRRLAGSVGPPHHEIVGAAIVERGSGELRRDPPVAGTVANGRATG